MEDQAIPLETEISARAKRPKRLIVIAIMNILVGLVSVGVDFHDGELPGARGNATQSSWTFSILLGIAVIVSSVLAVGGFSAGADILWPAITAEPHGCA